MTQPDPALKRTPLHAAHVRAGARMIPFGARRRGIAIAIEVRGRGQAARVVKTPFHPPRVKR